MPAPTISTSKCSTFRAVDKVREGAVTFMISDLFELAFQVACHKKMAIA
jgi:hypothetical protein